MSLAAGSAWDRKIPEEERITAEGHVQRVHKAEADLIVRAIEEDLQPYSAMWRRW